MISLPSPKALRRFFPVVAFLCGFVWDALTIGQRVRVTDFWQFGGYLLGSAVLIHWLAFRESRMWAEPDVEKTLRGRFLGLAWQAPYLLLQFLFGSIFSALFILYFKSSGHLGTWLTATLLGGLLIANEFAGRRYGKRFTLTWALFALNAILLFNFALPMTVGSLHPMWFYLSTAAGILLTHGLWRFASGRPGRIGPAWVVALSLVVAWRLDMIAPVPLVKQDIAIGHAFSQEGGHFRLQVEAPPFWQPWREHSATAHIAEGGKLYGISAVFAPLGIGAALEHRWEVYESQGWRVVYRSRFHSTGGRERGFRGYSWVLNPKPGLWRLIVATQDGRTIAIAPITVERGVVAPETLRLREF